MGLSFLKEHNYAITSSNSLWWFSIAFGHIPQPLVGIFIMNNQLFYNMYNMIGKVCNLNFFNQRFIMESNFLPIN